METPDFLSYFNHVPHLSKHFLGTFPIDKIPKTMKNKTFFVCNLDPSFMAGSHWIGLIKIISSEVEIFDSLGFRSDLICPYLNFTKSCTLIFNKTPVQDQTSFLCGKFVITFLVERMLNQSMSFHDIIEEVFSENLNKNDDIVNEYCLQLKNSV